MIGLLDTSIVIDALRNYAPANRWLSQQGQLGVTRIVWLEVLEGVINSQEQRRALVLLRRFTLIELITNDMVWATDQLVNYYLSHNIDAFDCLIASVSHRLQLPLYTNNLKHFKPLLGALANRPY